MFESTVSVNRNHIADDKARFFEPMFAQMGRLARLRPEELVSGLLKAGFATNCHDGQFFLDTDHVVIDPQTDTPLTVSNLRAGAGPAWDL